MTITPVEPPTMSHTPNTPGLRSRFLGAWWGIFIGDALGAYSDGYYNLDRLNADYPPRPGYIRPLERHPYNATNQKPVPELPPEFDFLQHRRERWTNAGTHYHHGLEAGDNTLPALLALDLGRHLAGHPVYRREEWLPAYRRRLTEPGAHRDFYIPGAHRDFLVNLARGRDIAHAGRSETHICGVVEALPVLLRRADDPDRRVRELHDHILLVRPCPAIVRAAEIFGEILPLVLSGHTLDDACFRKLGHHHDAYLAYPYHRWIAHHSDIEVATRDLGAGPLVDNAAPLSLYLALKYAGDFEKALTVNARLGGDAPSRGSVIGMLLGAVHGCEGIRAGLVGALGARDEIDAVGDALWDAFSASKPLHAAPIPV